MENSNEIQQLKKALGEVHYLRTLYYTNNEIKSWVNGVVRLLETMYGKESSEIHRFVNSCGTSFVVRTEQGQQQDYQYRLDCYESVLQALIAEKSSSKKG